MPRAGNMRNLYLPPGVAHEINCLHKELHELRKDNEKTREVPLTILGNLSSSSDIAPTRRFLGVYPFHSG